MKRASHFKKMPIRIIISGSEEAQKIASDLQALPDGMARGIGAAIKYENELTIRHVTREYLSFPKQGPTYPIGCRTVSGLLRKSFFGSEPVVSGNEISATIGSHVKYAAVQEFGFDGEETVAPYMRKSSTSQKIFGKKKMVRGADIGVRSYTRHMKIEGRGFVRRGIMDRAADYSTAISEAIVSAWEKSK